MTLEHFRCDQIYKKNKEYTFRNSTDLKKKQNTIYTSKLLYYVPTEINNIY